MQSEELSKINTALGHCIQLKSQLSGALVHIQRLNAKYNQIDYMETIRNLDAYYGRSMSCDDSFNSSFTIETNSSMEICGTPVNNNRKNAIFRRIVASKKLTLASPLTPDKQSAPITPISFTSTPSSTPKRTVREVKRNNNTISVRTIKVQRNIEAIISKLRVMQKSHQRNNSKMLERSLYQTCNNSMNQSPGKLGHTDCMEHSFCNRSANISNTSIHDRRRSGMSTPKSNNALNETFTVKRSINFNEPQRILQRVQQTYATPLKQMHKRLMHLNASLVRTC